MPSPARRRASCSPFPTWPTPFEILAVNSNGTATAIGASASTPFLRLPSSIRLADGHTVHVVTGADVGHIDGIAKVAGRSWTVRAPTAALSSFAWLTVTFSGGGGHNSFELDDGVGDPGHEITWWALPQSGHTVSVQVE